MSIPLILSLVTAAMICGAIVQRFGYYTPAMYAGSVVMSIGAGLITTFTTTTGHEKWIGYQVLFGLGMGMGMQQSNLAVQTVLKHKDVPTGSALIFFWQSLGGAIFISVGQNIFLDKFIAGLKTLPPGVINPKILISTGATEIRNVVPAKYMDEVLVAYNHALVKGPLFVGLILACLTVIGAIGMEWRSTKSQMHKEKPAEKQEDLEKSTLGEDIMV
jgi:MFS family permease